MTLEDVKRILEAEVIVGDEFLHRDVGTGCGSDLMSDVLAFVKPDCLLLTGLTNPQVVRTAEMADLGSVCFVRGKRPDKQTVKLARAKNIPLLTTPLSMFESCGRLYQEGVTSCFECRR